jgi:hypothetical protein
MSVWLAIGGAVIDGVLTEMPGLARQAVAAVVSGTVMTLPEGVSFGPFAAAAGPFAAFGLFTAATGGSMTNQGTIVPLSVAAGQYLSFGAGGYAVGSAAAPGGDVLTIGGVPLTLAGQPLQT